MQMMRGQRLNKQRVFAREPEGAPIPTLRFVGSEKSGYKYGNPYNPTHDYP